MSADTIESSPIGFAQTTLGLDLYDWQATVHSWFEDTQHLVLGTVCTPNGAGKSQRIVAPLALWWISVHPNGIVVITTKDSKQLDHQIWVAIESHRNKFPAYRFIEREVHTPSGGFIVGFTTDEAGRAEGWHKADDTQGPLLIICDEAKSIQEPIFEAIHGRCTYNAILYTSSPGLTEGTFYKSHSDSRLAYNPETGQGFRRMKVGLLQCPHIPQTRIDNVINTYGADHWLTRSTLHGEFTEADSDTLFVMSRSALRTAIDNPPQYVHGGDLAFCDFAAGRAENALGHLRGNRIEVVAWKDPDPMRAIARFIIEFRQRNLSPGKIYGDAGGMGIPILARFAELGWPLIHVNNDAAPTNPLRYENLGSETWHEGGIKLTRGDYILPDDEIMFEQLATRRSKPVGDGVIGLESKKDAAKRGQVSPDRGDVVVGVANAQQQLVSQLFDQMGLAKIDSMALLGKPELGAIVGGSYQPNAQNPTLAVYERPIIGLEYICVLDPFPHSDLIGNHVAVVLRKGYYDAQMRRQIPHRVAAMLLRPCRLDAVPLVHLIEDIQKFYGRCMCVPVINDRGDIIQALREQGSYIYAQQDFETTGHGRERMIRYGWESDAFTRSQWMGSLIEAVRQDNIQIGDTETAIELHQLRTDNAEMMRRAEAVGIGLRLIERATRYAPAKKVVTSASSPAFSMFG